MLGIIKNNMRAKTPHLNKYFNFRKISFNGILNSEFFFSSLSSIKISPQ